MRFFFIKIHFWQFLLFLACIPMMFTIASFILLTQASMMEGGTDTAVGWFGWPFLLIISFMVLAASYPAITEERSDAISQESSARAALAKKQPIIFIQIGKDLPSNDLIKQLACASTPEQISNVLKGTMPTTPLQLVKK